MSPRGMQMVKAGGREKKHAYFVNSCIWPIHLLLPPPTWLPLLVRLAHMTHPWFVMHSIFKLWEEHFLLACAIHLSVVGCCWHFKVECFFLFPDENWVFQHQLHCPSNYFKWLRSALPCLWENTWHKTEADMTQLCKFQHWGIITKL